MQAIEEVFTNNSSNCQNVITLSDNPLENIR